MASNESRSPDIVGWRGMILGEWAAATGVYADDFWINSELGDSLSGSVGTGDVVKPHEYTIIKSF
jgi:hypothetical protein